jgi:hypothetical protein
MSIIWQDLVVLSILTSFVLFSFVAGSPHSTPQLSQAKGAGELDRYVYPLAPRHEAPEIVIDISESPESKAWAEAAKSLVKDWYPLALSMLSTQDFKRPEKITLIFKKEIDVPAYAGGDAITINAKWVAEHPDDLGMVVHELVHVLQRYPRNRANTGWLTEGIADYIRWWRYEPEGPRPRITENSKMTDGYRVTAYFLAWAGKKYDLRLVPALDAALRKGEDPMPVFEKHFGKGADVVWKEFVAAVHR